MPSSALCPKCGCPPRFIVGPAQVRAVANLKDDKYVAGRAVSVRALAGAEYECGGQHRWPIPKEGP